MFFIHCDARWFPECEFGVWIKREIPLCRSPRSCLIKTQNIWTRFHSVCKHVPLHTHRHRRARQRDKSQFSTSRIQWRCRDDNLVKKSAPIPSENIISLVAWLDYVFTPGKTSPVPDYMDLHGKSRWECSLNFPEEIADFSHLCFTCFFLFFVAENLEYFILWRVLLYIIIIIGLLH